MKNILKTFARTLLAVALVTMATGCSFGNKPDAGGGSNTRETVATPVFSLEAGKLVKGDKVEISCTTEDAVIHYTTNGDEPTATSEIYREAITVNTEMTIKAIAIKDGMNDSTVASAAYSLYPTYDYSKCVVGDFILKDGSILSKDETPEKDTVAAVIIRAKTSTVPALGIGIIQSNEIQWSRAANGYAKIDKLTDITSGKNSWDILLKACPDVLTKPDSYQAWTYTHNYGENNNLEGPLARGWFLPAPGELSRAKKEKTVINESLEKAGGHKLNNYYWTCKQAPEATEAIIMDLYGSTSTQPNIKTYKRPVRAMRLFE